MLFLRFSSNITPRIFLATASSLASCCPNFCRSLAQAAAEFICVSMARLVASSRSAIMVWRFAKRWVGTGTEMGDGISERVLHGDAGGADAKRVLLAVEGYALSLIHISEPTRR